MLCQTCDYLQPDLTSLSLTSETVDVTLYRILGCRDKISCDTIVRLWRRLPTYGLFPILILSWTILSWWYRTVSFRYHFIPIKGSSQKILQLSVVTSNLLPHPLNISLKNKERIWDEMSKQDLEKLTHVFFSSILDYCDVLFTRFSKKVFSNSIVFVTDRKSVV